MPTFDAWILGSILHSLHKKNLNDVVVQEIDRALDRDTKHDIFIQVWVLHGVITLCPIVAN